MNEATSADTVFVFGSFRLDPAHGVLTCDGAPIVLTSRLRDTLCCLLENAGRLVTKDELLQAVWPGRIADETNLSQAISGLRKALGARGEGMILTESGKGYRFAAPVERVSDGATQGAAAAQGFGFARWRIWAVVAGLAGAAIAAAIALTPWKRAPERAASVSVVLANFQNFTQDAAFEHVMDKALEADLAQSPYLVITPDSKIAETLGLMGLAKDAPLTADRAREVCERNNGGVVIAGAVGQLGAHYVITLTSADCASGRILDEQKQEAAGKEAVAAAVDQLAERTRRRLGEPAASITRFDVPLMPERTASFEALQAYSEGLWLHDHGRVAEAIPQFQHAIEIDPNFAMAYARLSTTYFNLQKPVEDRKYITIAYGLRKQVSEPERFYISERYQQSVTRNTEEGLRILHEWTGVYPRDSRAWVNLSNQANGIGRYAEATAAARRALDLGEHTAASYYALITDDAKSNHLAEAEALGREAMGKGVAGGSILGETMRIASLRHDEATVRDLMEQARGKPAERDALAAASDIALAKGRRRGAFALLDQADALGRDQPAQTEATAKRAFALALFGLSGEARTILAAPTPSLDPETFLYAMASVGDAGRAESELEKDLKTSPSDTLLNRQFAPEIRAVIALRRGRSEEAAQALGPASPYELRDFRHALSARRGPVGRQGPGGRGGRLSRGARQSRPGSGSPIRPGASRPGASPRGPGTASAGEGGIRALLRPVEERRLRSAGFDRRQGGIRLAHGRAPALMRGGDASSGVATRRVSAYGLADRSAARFGKKSPMKSVCIPALLAATFSSLAAGACAQPAVAYTVTKAVPLGAPDRWDYVVFDPGSYRVYVAHADHVSVVDGHDGKVLGEVDGITGGTHGIGISSATGQGFTDDGRGGLAVAFDLKTFKVKTRIAAQADADAIAFDRASGHVFIIDGEPQKITVIDPKTDAVVATIDGGGGLEYAVSDDHGSLYVAGASKRDIVKVNTRTNAVEAHWPIPGCASPHGIAIDVAAHRVFISCVNSLLVAVDTDSGATVATVPTGPGTDAAAFDPKRKLVFSSNGIDGTLSVIAEKDPNTFVPVATIKTAITGRTMSIDPQTGRIYIAAGDLNPNPAPGQSRLAPGSLKLLFLDPSQ